MYFSFELSTLSSHTSFSIYIINTKKCVLNLKCKSLSMIVMSGRRACTHVRRLKRRRTRPMKSVFLFCISVMCPSWKKICSHVGLNLIKLWYDNITHSVLFCVSRVSSINNKNVINKSNLFSIFCLMLYQCNMLYIHYLHVLGLHDYSSSDKSVKS